MTGNAAMTSRTRRGAFATPPCPYLDDVYTLARYLLRNAADAEDAVQECYLRALRHFDSYRGPAMKPWLLAILRNVCHAEFARRGARHTPTADHRRRGGRRPTPLWQEPPLTPETAAAARAGRCHTIRRLVAALAAAVPGDHRAAGSQQLVLPARSPRCRGVPVGTVMSRLARAALDAARGLEADSRSRRAMTCDDCAEILFTPDRRRARRRPCPRGRGPCRRLARPAPISCKLIAPCGRR